MRIIKQITLILIFIFFVSLFSSCLNAQKITPQTKSEIIDIRTENIEFPELGEPIKLEKDVLFYEVSLKRTLGVSKLWIYLPEKAKNDKIPCIFIAPAGSTLFHGTYLGNGSKPEHLPYVRAGFAVIAYELDGIPPQKKDLTWLDYKKPATEFRNADAGLANAKIAINFAISKIPQIDSTKLYSAGHSSAATLSLLFAENEPRIKASIAYAPVTNLPQDLGTETVSLLDKMIPGYKEFLIQSSPINHSENLKCPVFLFYAKDDSIVPNEQSIEFAEKVKKTNSSVTLVSTENGDHYDSMIKYGIPQAIEWLKKLKN